MIAFAVKIVLLSAIPGTWLACWGSLAHLWRRGRFPQLDRFCLMILWGTAATLATAFVTAAVGG